jgi:hypothetical protein
MQIAKRVKLYIYTNHHKKKPIKRSIWPEPSHGRQKGKAEERPKEAQPTTKI